MRRHVETSRLLRRCHLASAARLRQRDRLPADLQPQGPDLGYDWALRSVGELIHALACPLAREFAPGRTDAFDRCIDSRDSLPAVAAGDWRHESGDSCKLENATNGGLLRGMAERAWKQRKLVGQAPLEANATTSTACIGPPRRGSLAAVRSEIRCGAGRLAPAWIC